MRSEIAGGVRSTTCAVWVTTVSLPALSRAVTVTARGPSVAVSSGSPFATLPSQEARPEPPSSAQLKATLTVLPRDTSAPSSGTVRSTVGGVLSGGAQAAVPVRATR